MANVHYLIVAHEDGWADVVPGENTGLGRVLSG
jgi:hypothetical protein